MSQLARAHVAVDLARLNLAGHLVVLDALPEARRRAAEEVALKRQRLEGLEVAARILQRRLCRVGMPCGIG